MTLEELQAENAKLNGRLQKAITVFGEQKANIERVTTERDEARKQLADAQARVSELEAKTQESANDDAKFFEQLEEINTLNDQVAKLKKEVETITADLTKRVEAYEKLEEDKDALLNQLDTEKANHKNDLAESGKKIDELNGRLTKAAESYKEQQDKITRLQDAYDKSQELLAQAQEQRDEDNANSAAEIKALNDELDAKNKRLTTMQTSHDKAVERAESVKQQVNQIRELSNNLITDFNIFA